MGAVCCRSKLDKVDVEPTPKCIEEPPRDVPPEPQRVSVSFTEDAAVVEERLKQS